MKRIAVLGSTGSIGRQTLDVIRNYPDQFKVVGLACCHFSKTIKEQIKEFKPEVVSITERDGEKAIFKVATWPSADLVVVAVVGITGLLPTMKAIEAGKDVALATKEVMVAGGELVKKAVTKHKVNLLPIDSEPSAIFQCLSAGKKREIRRIILTMGKGKIAEMSQKELKKVKLRNVFQRKAWKMGPKISLDSATCMNKSFEVIEAKHLFEVGPEQIEILVHPEYLCHSLVEFVDGSLLAEIGVPDMRRYIQYALFYPERKATKVSSYLDLINKKISFEKPPYKKFPCLNFGFEALKIGGTMPAAMLGADEATVKAFAEGKVSFMDIPKIIKKTMVAHKPIKNPNLSQIIKATEWGERKAYDLCCHYRGR